MLPRAMRSLKYPLEALARVRRDKVDEAARALAAAAREHASRAQDRSRAERRRDDLRRAAQAVQGAELEALAHGDLSAADLARAHAWSLRVAAQEQVLAADADRALAAEQRAQAEEDAARSRLLACRVDARQVEMHRERWDADGRRDAEKREEETSAEAWRPAR